jgi:hypothetical protein
MATNNTKKTGLTGSLGSIVHDKELDNEKLRQF